METDPLAFLRNEIPLHFARGIEALRASSSPDARERLDDVLKARGAVRIIIGGAGEVWLRVEGGTLTAHDTRPQGVPVRVALEFESEAAREALSMFSGSGRIDDPQVSERFVRMFSARAEKILEGQKVEFHVVVKDVPDRDDDIVIKVGIGTDVPPSHPQFTVAVSYDDLEDLRAGELTADQVIGRLRLTGDASRAMSLGMMLMQPPTSQAKR
jgi:hypothetical protein